MDTTEPANDSTTEQASGSLMGGPLAAGAVVGTLVAAVIAGSFVLVIILALGAVVGAMAAGIVALASQRLKGRSVRSGDRPTPTLTPHGTPAAKRSEAGQPSPAPAGR